jgi:hypothetical protein
MRIAALLLLIGAACSTLPSWAGDAFGLWKVRLADSTFGVRFEPHAKGEVFTLDRIDTDGRWTTSSTILYLDSKPHDFQGFGCSGTQSSRRLDSQTVEVLRTCGSGERMRLIRRLSTKPNQLVLEIAEQQPDGRRLERRLLLKKQHVEKH